MVSPHPSIPALKADVESLRKKLAMGRDKEREKQQEIAAERQALIDCRDRSQIRRRQGKVPQLEGELVEIQKRRNELEATIARKLDELYELQEPERDAEASPRERRPLWRTMAAGLGQTAHGLWMHKGLVMGVLGVGAVLWGISLFDLTPEPQSADAADKPDHDWRLVRDEPRPSALVGDLLEEGIRPVVRDLFGPIGADALEQRKRAILTLKRTTAGPINDAELVMILGSESRGNRLALLELIVDRLEPYSLKPPTLQLILAGADPDTREQMLLLLVPHIHGPIDPDDALAILADTIGRTRMECLRLISPMLTRPIGAEHQKRMAEGMTAADRRAARHIIQGDVPAITPTRNPVP